MELAFAATRAIDAFLYCIQKSNDEHGDPVRSSGATELLREFTGGFVFHLFSRFVDFLKMKADMPVGSDMTRMPHVSAASSYVRTRAYSLTRMVVIFCCGFNWW